MSESIGIESPISEVPSSPEYYRSVAETGGDSPASSVATRRSNGAGSDTSKDLSGYRSGHKPGAEKKKNRNWYNVSNRCQN